MDNTANIASSVFFKYYLCYEIMGNLSCVKDLTYQRRTSWINFVNNLYRRRDVCRRMQLIDLPSPHGDCEPSETYVESHCLAECEANYIINNCSCKDIYMPGIAISNTQHVL